jgi:calcineurin-like phosphoesterase family protein
MNYYTADPHFGHASILRFCSRPFRDVAEMDAHILSAYQAVMRAKDDLWIIGDFAFAKIDEATRLEALLAAIPGRKHLIKGNHDKPWMTTLSGWHSVHDLIEVKEGGYRLTLCHYPMVTFPGARHQAVQLFGHVHQNWKGSRNSVNVGVDVWGFRPVTLPDILDRAQTLPVNPLWDTVEPGAELQGADGRA